jgi:hypothetical protein
MASKKTQIGKFKQAARELETDDDEKSFPREAGQHRQAEARRETGEAQAQIALFSEHWSSCDLHSGPTRWPRGCDCGGTTIDKRSSPTWGHPFYKLSVAVRNECQLWSARSVWLRESHASPLRYPRRVASSLALGHRRLFGAPEGAAPPSAASSHKRRSKSASRE